MPPFATRIAQQYYAERRRASAVFFSSGTKPPAFQTATILSENG
jgi:hypothetical protein